MVYLLCFHNHFKHAKHYIGFCDGSEKLEARMKRHRSGQGAKLMAAVTKAGIDFDVVRLWPDADRNFERKLKNRKKSSQLCPMCIYHAKMLKHLPMTFEEAQVPQVGPDFPIIPRVG